MNALLNGQAFELRLGDSLTVQNLWKRSEQIREDLAERIESDQHVVLRAVNDSEIVAIQDPRA
jgi:hypothetical protein